MSNMAVSQRIARDAWQILADVGVVASGGPIEPVPFNSAFSAVQSALWRCVALEGAERPFMPGDPAFHDDYGDVTFLASYGQIAWVLAEFEAGPAPLEVRLWELQEVYVPLPKPWGDKKPTAAEAKAFLFGFGVESERRADEFCDLATSLRRPAFWQVFADIWTSCDGTHHLQDRLLYLLKAKGPAPETDFFQTLPDEVTVYRGCSRERVEALAWSIDLTVAQAFARGHRGIRVPDPVIASAVVPRSMVLFATDDRGEKEVLIDFGRLRPSDVTVTDFVFSKEDAAG